MNGMPNQKKIETKKNLDTILKLIRRYYSYKAFIDLLLYFLASFFILTLTGSFS